MSLDSAKYRTIFYYTYNYKLDIIVALNKDTEKMTELQDCVREKHVSSAMRKAVWKNRLKGNQFLGSRPETDRNM